MALRIFVRSKYLVTIFLMFWLCFGISKKAACQNASFYDVMHDLELVRQNFSPSQGNYASCAMSFLYSSESAPTTYTDSLKGIYKASSSARYIKIANAETVQNDSVILSIYNDDKLIAVAPASVRGNANQSLMLTNLDSSFVARNASAITITQINGVNTMTFTFSPTSQFYTCQLVYDATTYIPSSLSYILKTSKSFETGQQPRDGGLITIQYSGYSNSVFDTSILNTSKYISVASGKAQIQPGYAGYNIIKQATVPGIGK